nr:tyrosine-type recombinase/integrase [Rhodoblastus sphagnicola]
MQPGQNEVGSRMARPKSQGPCKVNKKLASGEVETYYYAWRGGPRITDPITGKPYPFNSKQFKIRFAELLQQREGPAQTALAIKGPFVQDLIAKFKTDPIYFGNLSVKTKTDYTHLLDKIGAKFGDMPLRAVDEFGARKDFLDWRNDMMDKPRTADACWTMLKRLFNFGIDRQEIKVNPCLGGGKLYASDRSDKVWMPEHLAKLKAVAPKQVWDVVELAEWTGQRMGDLLQLTWDDFDGEVITLIQSKSKRRGQGGVKVIIPVLASLQEILDRLPRRDRTNAMLIPTKRSSERWTEDGFKTVFGRAKTSAGITDLHFHDLRGTFVLHAAEAGCTVPEIASITGHKLGEVQTIIDKYLPKTKTQSLSAMQKIEAKKKNFSRTDA